MIVQVPSVTPVTTPSSTIATSSSVDAQVTVDVMPLGVRVAVRVVELLTTTDAADTGYYGYRRLNS